MATAFSTFDTTPAGAVAAIKAAILASSDWSNPAGDRVQATTTRGAAMVVDLADAAASALRLQFGVYRTTGLADKIIRYLQWRASGGATSDPLHVTVSAGKEHLFLTVEGPRSGEPNPDDTTQGSQRPFFWFCDLLPYFASDTIPAVVCGGTTAPTYPDTASTTMPVHVSRNAANNASWVVAGLETLQPPHGTSNPAWRYTSQSISAVTGGLLARPWVVFEDVAGMRGRLAQFFFLGWNVAATAGVPGDIPAQTFQRITIGGITYIGLTVNKRGSFRGMSSFAQTESLDNPASPVVAVPYS